MIKTGNKISAVVAASLWAGALVACGAPDQPPAHGGKHVEPALTAKPEAGATTAKPEAGGPALGCRLPAPKKSEDACSSDGDCGVSDPCHAKECVARARSHPPTPEVMCTRSMECHTADANRCGCFEGKCSLIPPKG